jgi:hypothetical protein
MLIPASSRSSARIAPGWTGGNIFFLVVIDDFDIMRSFSFNPPKTDAPLVVNPNAVLAFPLAG